MQGHSRQLGALWRLETFPLTPCKATCGLGRKTCPCPVRRVRTDGVREFLALSAQRPASGGSWQNTQSTPGPTPRPRLVCWALTPGLLGITGQVFVRMHSFKGLYL